MKRKRGIAKRKPKIASSTKEGIPNIASANTQDEWELDAYNNNEVNGTTEIEPPQKGNQQNCQGGLQNQKVVELPVEDSTSAFSGLNAAVSTSLLKKSRSKMSKPLKSLSSPSTKQISNAEKVQIEGTCQRGLELPNQDPEYKNKELKVSLEVIRKVMKMDAAAPFNDPVDPVALGIPDYFDIIDTPMDFGTICYNIENGVKYKNSKEVLRDVQYIWDNCCKYNKKGHYILELMKLVKKNFTKYWTEAGLYKEQEQEMDEDTSFPPLKPITTSSIYGYKSPLGSLADCARSLQHDGEDLTRPHPDQPSSARIDSYKYQQRPSHYQLGSTAGYAESTMRRNPHHCSMNLLDYSFTHPHPNQYHHEIPPFQSSLWKNEPYQPQQRSCHCHPSPLQPQHSHQQARTFVASVGHPCTNPLTEHTVMGSPCGRRFFESHHAENSSWSHQNKIFHEPECHDHRSSLCCSQPYRPRREFCHCVVCSERKQPSRSTAGVEDDNAGDSDSHHAEHFDVSYTKQGPRNSKRPMTNLTSHLPLDQMASSCLHELQPLDTCGVEECFSPPPLESKGTVGKGGPAKYSTVPTRHTISDQLDELTPNQMQPDKSDVPQLECFLDQSCRQPQISRPEALWDMFHTGSNKTKKKSRSRGPTRCLKVFDSEDKIPITTNEAGEAIGPEASKLISFLGVIARNGHVAPLSYVQWKAMPEENKEKMWQLVQSKFDINPESKFWALKSLAKKWTCWKAFLKVNHYNPHETDEARLADCNERVLPEQWRILVEYWNTPEAQVVSNTNKANASHMKLCHASGTKSFARLREEERLKRPDGKEPSEADLFILTRTRKNGRPVTEASSTIISQLRDAAQQKQGTLQPDTIDNDVFVQVMGEDKHKRKRGPTKTLPPEAEKIVSEAKAEVLEMKEKMVAVEQTCAQMAAQMATMMSMMQKNFTDNNKPNLDATVNPDESDDVSASHNGFQAPEGPATETGKKHSVGKVARRRHDAEPLAL